MDEFGHLLCFSERDLDNCSMSKYLNEFENRHTKYSQDKETIFHITICLLLLNVMNVLREGIRISLNCFNVYKTAVTVHMYQIALRHTSRIRNFRNYETIISYQFL